MTGVLQLEGLTVDYGGVRALASVDLEVDRGQLVGLIGPNGAGKTTLIDATTGFARATGDVHLNGATVTGRPPHQRARLGLVRTWQAADLFDDLTVRENLKVAVRARRDAPAKAIEELLSEVGLDGLGDLPADALSQGQRKLVGVARALASDPQVVCLDEPAAGLDTDESVVLGGRLRTMADGGLGMLLVDHDMGLVLSVCDQVVVLNFGQVIARGTPAQIRRDPVVIEAYLGGAAKDVAGATTVTAGDGRRT